MPKVPNSLSVVKSLSELLPDLVPDSSGELHGPCWRCGGRDRFFIFKGSGRGYCRQCAWSGDSIQYLRDRQGLTFLEAAARLGEPLPPADPHRQAQREKKARFRDWARKRLIALTDEYRRLSLEKPVLEHAYRASHRGDSQAGREERAYWTDRLAHTYDRLAWLETELDLFTFKQHEPMLFSSWKEEEEDQ
jgi:phage/plasmid primase-like uncharacterized protein